MSELKSKIARGTGAAAPDASAAPAATPAAGTPLAVHPKRRLPEMIIAMRAARSR